MEKPYRRHRALKATAVALPACILLILLFVFALDKPLAATSPTREGPQLKLEVELPSTGLSDASRN